MCFFPSLLVDVLITPFFKKIYSHMTELLRQLSIGLPMKKMSPLTSTTNIYEITYGNFAIELFPYQPNCWVGLYYVFH